jgi:sensor histidine kinase YesM
MVYDIETKDFFIPSLTVQPLVENAVKYGVGKKKEGGTAALFTGSPGQVLPMSTEGQAPLKALQKRRSRPH